MRPERKGGVAILDFGSQYTKLIARRIREQHVYSEIVSPEISCEQLLRHKPRAVILSGGPSSVYEKTKPEFDKQILELDIPVLGICYGLQLLADFYGGRVENAEAGEYGFAELQIEKSEGLFSGIGDSTRVWMSHMDRLTRLPEGWEILARSGEGIIAAMAHVVKKRFATQFHPEVVHTSEGETILRNFLFQVAHCMPDWTPGNFIQEQMEKIREQVGNRAVLVGVSGGVDSTVVAALLHRAIGNQSKAVLIDHGLMRKREAEECISALESGLGVPVQVVDDSGIFLEKLKNVSDPEQKRRIIGEQFIRSFERVAKELGEIQFLAQGTLYPDVIESGFGVGQSTHTIKSHHNVGGLPESMGFELIEPLRDLFKDEVRNVGRELGLPESLIQRHPFPGPGLAVRILGAITPERLSILREADDIYIRTLQAENLYHEIWQAFSILIPVKTVGVMGDQRTYEYLLALRAVTSSDGMTADWFRMPDEVLSKISSRIVNSVKGINRVVYDITTKPPGTIEWE